MSESIEDTGLTLNQLWGAAWILGIVGVFAWLQVATSLEGPQSLNQTWATWLAGAVLGTVSCACCTILAAVKAAEARLRSADPEPHHPSS